MAESATKRCNKCGRVFPLSEYGRDKSMRDGHTGSCRECTNARKRRWKAANPDKVREMDLRSRAKNADKIRERRRRNWELNGDVMRARSRAWRQANPERSRESSRRWRARMKAENPDLVYERNHEQHRKYYEANREAIKARLAARNAKMRADVLSKYSQTEPPSCACCGATADLSIDHVNGDGAPHRNEIGPGLGIYRWLRRNGFPPGYQLLCRPCNSSKSRRRTRCELRHD